MSILSIWEHLQVIFGSSGSDLGGLRGCREGCLGHFCVFWGWFGGLRGCRGGCLGNPGALGGHVGGIGGCLGSCLGNLGALGGHVGGTFAPTWRHAGAQLGVMLGLSCEFLASFVRFLCIASSILT